MSRWASKAAVLAGCVVLGPAVCGQAVGRDGLPLVAGDLSIANQIVHGDAHLVTVGDSILQRIAPAYVNDWAVDRWSGLVLGRSLAGGEYQISNPQVATSTIRNPLEPVGPAGVAGGAPGAQVEFTFNGTTAPAVDSDPKVLANRFYELGLDSSVGVAGQFANTGSGTLNLTPLIYANANGAADGTVAMSVRINSTDVPVAVAPLHANAAVPTMVGSTVTIPAQAWDAGHYLATDFRIIAGAAPVAGSDLAVVGVRVSNGGPGFQLANTSNGGWNIENFLDETITSAANLKQYVNLTDSNIALIQIGANDIGIDTAADFKVKLQALVDRYKATRPDMKIILMSTYDLGHGPGSSPYLEADGTPRQVAFDRDMYDIATGEPNVMFLNLYDQVADWATLNATYLSDGTHPTTAGNDYFAGQQWNLVTQAASASTPEPSAIGVTAGIAALLGIRRRRSVAIRRS